MAATTTVRELFRRVSTQLQDIDPQFERWTQQAMVDAATDGERTIAKFLPPSVARVDAIKLTPGPRQLIDEIAADSIKPGNGSTPVTTRGLALLPGPIRNMGATGTTPGAVARPVDRQMLDSTDPSWMSITGKVVREVVVERLMPRQFWVTPAPKAGDNVWLEISWAIQPPAIDPARDYVADGGDDTLLTIDDTNVDDLMHYMLGRLLLADAEYAPAGNLASNYMQLFISSINRQAVAMGLQRMPSAPAQQEQA